jgi:hypothetical protein
MLFYCILSISSPLFSKCASGASKLVSY